MSSAFPQRNEHKLASGDVISLLPVVLRESLVSFSNVQPLSSPFVGFRSGLHPLLLFEQHRGISLQRLSALSSSLLSHRSSGVASLLNCLPSQLSTSAPPAEILDYHSPSPSSSSHTLGSISPVSHFVPGDLAHAIGWLPAAPVLSVCLVSRCCPTAQPQSSLPSPVRCLGSMCFTVISLLHLSARDLDTSPVAASPMDAFYCYQWMPSTRSSVTRSFHKRSYLYVRLATSPIR